jgi:ferric-dicitrate binding protein FerR (iron transport regulator)
MPLPDPTDIVLVRYLAGQLDGEELAALEAWLAERPERREQLDALRAIWTASGTRIEGPDVESGLVRLWERIRAEHPGTREASAPSGRPTLVLMPPARPSSVWRIWALAAALVLVVGGGLHWRARHEAAEMAGRESAARSTYATARGQRASLSLSDGTAVLLNTESSLEVPTSYGRGTRDVYLRGEAYFEVAHDSTRPFRVHAGTATTRVLGTKFGVRARPGEDAVQVLVTEGQVALSASRTDSPRPVLLGHGDLGRLGNDGSATVMHDVTVATGLAWMSGGLVFERAPLPEVLAELGRWYDRDFVLGDASLAATRLTTVLRGESVQEAIHVLEASLDVRCRVAGRTITIERRRTGGGTP